MKKIAYGVVHGKQRSALRELTRIFGDDASTILNALHEMSARIAITAGVEPDVFAAGVKHHWDFLVNEINERMPENAALLSTQRDSQ